MTICSAGVTLRFTKHASGKTYLIFVTCPLKLLHIISVSQKISVHICITYILPFFIHRDILVDFTFKGH